MASIDTRASEVAMPSQPHQTISGIITKLQHLSQRVSQDRIPYIPKDFLLHSVVVGEGFVAGKRKLNEEDEESDNEDDDEELPLFLNEPLPNNDTPYNPKEGLRDEDEDLVPEEEEEVDIHFDENIKWLNDLKSHIVSCFLLGRRPISINLTAHNFTGRVSLNHVRKLSISCHSS
jgi:hypothetical protein